MILIVAVAQRQSEISCVGDHGAVISAELRAGIEYFDTRIGGCFAERVAQSLVGADTTRDHEPLAAGLLQRSATFYSKRVDRGQFKGNRNIGDSPLIQHMLSTDRCNMGFQTAEAEIQTGSAGHWTGEDKPVRVTLPRCFRYGGASRVSESEEFGCFVEGFSGGIVDSLTQNVVLPRRRDINQHCMATRYQ